MSTSSNTRIERDSMGEMSVPKRSKGSIKPRPMKCAHIRLTSALANWRSPYSRKNRARSSPAFFGSAGFLPSRKRGVIFADPSKTSIEDALVNSVEVYTESISQQGTAADWAHRIERNDCESTSTSHTLCCHGC